jgi:hypothetical protein
MVVRRGVLRSGGVRTRSCAGDLLEGPCEFRRWFWPETLLAESGPPTRCFALRLAKRRLRADSVRRPGVRDHHGSGEREQERDSSEDEEGDGNPRHGASGCVAAYPACPPRHTASVAAQAASGRVRARASA